MREIFIYKGEIKIIVIGITGKTGCGKSYAAKYLSVKLNNSLIIDVDLLAKEIYRHDRNIVEKISAIFGKDILDASGNIDFSGLGRIVFDDVRQMKKLNALMFPLIKENIFKIINNNQGKKYVIIDAAILFDAGLDTMCDKIIFMKANPQKREYFLKCKNSGLSTEDIKQRINNQEINANENKIDFTIKNESSAETLDKNIDLFIGTL